MMGSSDTNSTARAARVLTLAGARLVVPGSDTNLPIGASGLSVGSRSDADVCVDDPMVSRRHLFVASQPEGIRILDVGSRNGTFLNGVRIHDVVVNSDVVVTIGRTQLAIEFEQKPIELNISPRTRFGSAIGFSRAMRNVFHLLEQVANTDATVLLEGQSGTGKDVLAVALHEEGSRSEGPFVVVDCGAISENLIESELFGHEKGAFTGALKTRMGAFEQANGGTVFLDEIGELPIGLQPKLLRVLESRTFRRVGGNRTLETDVRIIAATNRPLREAVKNKEFREDLYYRLSVVHINVPPLAQRVEDIGPIAEEFLRNSAATQAESVPPELLQLLTAYHWPGNVRELRNVIERFGAFGRLDANTLFGPVEYRPEPDSKLWLNAEALLGQPYHDAKRQLLEEFHDVLLPAVLERAGGSVTRAAELLGLPRTSVSRMLKRNEQRRHSNPRRATDHGDFAASDDDDDVDNESSSA